MIRPILLLDRSRNVAKSGIRPTNQNIADTVAYVETAKTSHINGLRNCGQIPIVFGYGNSQYISHGRPRWKIGYMPACATAKSVIASAKRLIDVRQRCRSKSSIAEINVPAWPIPIHQTKLRMSMPQATGTLTPHKPIPTNRRFVIASSINWKSANEIAKPKNHASDVLRFKTIELILSVTDANVSPGSITGEVECIGPSVYGFWISSCISLA